MIHTASITPEYHEDVVRILEEGIETGLATFRSQEPTPEQWHHHYLPHSRWGAFVNTQLVGWGALSPVSSRPEYSGVAEVSIYVAKHYRENGIGNLLLQQLKDSSEQNNIWSLYASIIEMNVVSRKLVLKHGFREIGYREKISKIGNVWHNTWLYEYRHRLF